jgi:hypothetical protein
MRLLSRLAAKASTTLAPQGREHWNHAPAPELCVRVGSIYL